jgi:hypothetical protein
LELYPEGAKVKDRFWQALPLHFCVHRDRDDLIDFRVVEIVLSAYPEATAVTDGAHFLPIHRAGEDVFSFDCSPKLVNRALPHQEIISLLLQRDQHSAKVTTSNGNTCLHWFLSHPFPRTSIDLQILETLVAAFPQSIFVKNNEKKTPLQLLIGKAALEDAEFVENSSDPAKAQYGAKYILGHLLELSQLHSSSNSSSD